MQIDHNTVVAASAARPGAGRPPQNGPRRCTLQAASSGTRPDSLKERATFGVGGASGILFLLLLLQSRLVLLLQDDLLCNAAMQLLLRLTTAAQRFAAAASGS